MSHLALSGVAVVIPAHQGADVLDTTLASVAGQRLRADEIVVVDDGSTDGTAEVARRWSTVAPVRVEVQSQRGPAAARRAGVAATTAPLLAFVDADDVWLPDHLAVAVAAHRRHGGLISPDAISWQPGAALPAATRRQRFPVPSVTDQRQAILSGNFVFSSVLLSRHHYLGAGGFRDGVTGAEDWDLWIRLIRRGVEVHDTDRATWLYRIAPGSLTRRPEMLATYQVVLQRALTDDTDVLTTDEQATVVAHLGRLRARDCLAQAYDAARERRPRDARRWARRAVGGRSRVTAEALSVLAAPRIAARLGDRARARWAEDRR